MQHFFFRHTNVFMCENNCILLFCVSAYMNIFRSSDESKVLLDTKTMGKLFGSLTKILIFSITLSSNHALFSFFFLSRKLFSTFGEIQQRKKSIFIFWWISRIKRELWVCWDSCILFGQKLDRMHISNCTLHSFFGKEINDPPFVPIKNFDFMRY